MRIVRPASLLIATVLLATACAKTVDSPGRGDTATPFGGADASANGSVGSTPGYLNAAGAEKNPNAGKPAAAPAPAATAPAAAPAADTSAKH
ncbi:MAG: hypothetical protein V4813_14245 [Gemmatimonadota bacterium]